MGIIANVKQKLTNMASEKVTSAAALTPKQLAAVEEKGWLIWPRSRT